MPSVVANRYASALADVVAPTGHYRQVLAELEDFAVLYRESAELQEVFDSPTLSFARKQSVLDALAGRLGSSHVTQNFLRVLASHYRMPILEEAIQAFRNIAYARLGIVQVKISSAAELSAAQQDLLRRHFSELTRQQPYLEFQLDPQLIGGIVAQIGSTVYDGSIRGQLERIREQIIGKL